MAIEYVNAKPNDTLAGTDRFRMTWARPLGAWLPGWTWDASARAIQLRDWFPSVGAVPVSGVSASDGDESIVFDIRPATSMYGRTLALLINQMSDPPGVLGGEPDLVKVERITYQASGGQSASQANAAAQAAAVASGNAAANVNPIGGAAKSATDYVLSVVKYVAFGAVALAVVYGIYTFAPRRK